MSLRLLSHKLVKHGRYFLQAIWKREIYLNILEQQHKSRNRLQSSAKALKSAVTAACPQQQQLVAKNVLQSSIGAGSQSGSLTARQANGIFRFGQQARKLFIDNLLNRCTSPYSQPLRTQATKKLFYGDSAPFFALIGVSLASGAGILTKEDELEGVCWEIREAASRLQKSWNYDDISDTLTTDFNIDKLNVGPPIAKGCAAVVYAASFKNQGNEAGKENNLNETNINHVQKIETTDDLLASTSESGDGLHNIMKSSASYRPEFMTPLRNLSRFVHNFGSSVDNLQNISHTATIKQLKDVLNTLNLEKEKDKQFQNRRKSEERLSNAEGIPSSNIQTEEESRSDTTDLVRYPLALKMMFNYDIQSNALAILRAMYKETVPARQRYINPSAEGWERLLADQTLSLPAHPNIVTMFGFFCDEVKSFQEGHLLYPVAQPQRINPQGYGRNMSLYLLMKRYDYSLRNLLDSQDLNTRTKLLLFTQLLEAVAYINSHGIAHRDLKSDNILIEMNDDDSPPVLVISDFGCCLADKVHGLRVPYNSYDIDKGGNAALMAPEIINKQPGSFSVLNYTKADLWACGAIAYEIFGQPNPFYAYPQMQSKSLLSSEQYQALKNSNYKAEELPPLNETCPELIQNLIYNILDPNPSKRISPDIAANVMQLYLWAPSKWLKSSEMPNSPEILQWLLSLTTKIMCEGNNSLGNLPSSVGLPEQLSFSQHGRRTFVEYLLICSFLARARLRCIRGALNWIQNTNQS